MENLSGLAYMKFFSDFKNYSKKTSIYDVIYASPPLYIYFTISLSKKRSTKHTQKLVSPNDSD